MKKAPILIMSFLLTLLLAEVPEAVEEAVKAKDAPAKIEKKTLIVAKEESKEKEAKKAKEEEAKKAKEEKERKAKEEKAKKKAEGKARKEAEKKAKEEKERKAKEEKERKAKEEEAEKKAEEKARKEAGKKTKEEKERKAKEEEAEKKAEVKARKEAKEKAKEAKSKSKKTAAKVKKSLSPASTIPRQRAAAVGRTGLIRTLSVKSLDQGNYGISALAQYFYTKRSLSYRSPGEFPSDVILSEKSQRLIHSIALSYGAYQWKRYPLGLEVSLTESGAGHSLRDREGHRALVQRLGDMELGFKLGYGLDEGIGVGFDGFFQLLTSVQNIGYTSDAISGGFRVLSTFDLADIEGLPLENVPLTLHLNLGYKVNNSKKLRVSPNITPEGEFAQGIIPANQLLLAFALEYPIDTIEQIEFLLPFIEYSVDKLSGRGFTESPQRITLGTRIFPVKDRSLSVDLGLDIGVSRILKVYGYRVNAEPPLSIALGVGYTILPSVPTVAPLTTGKVAGKVLDADTGNPIKEAAIAFPGTGLSSILTDANGRYTSCGMEAGKVEVIASRNGYISQTKKVRIEAAKTVTQDFSLRKLIKVGILKGKVTDTKIRPLAAVISFEKPIASGATDPITGEYTMKLPPGGYKVTATAQGYKPQTKPAVIKDKGTTKLNFVLEAIARVGELEGKVTNEKGEPLTAQVTVDVKGIPPMATDPRTGIYRGRLPAGAYQVTAGAKGYSSQTKPAAIRDKKKTILNFVLKLKVAPPVKKPLAVLRAKKIEILEKIHFETGKAVILPESYPILDDVAKILIDHPKIKILIEGHTDSVGTEAYNLKLSEARAGSVMKYILDKGVPSARLKSAGFGESSPLADNTTATGRAKNRRVEFTIISQ